MRKHVIISKENKKLIKFYTLKISIYFLDLEMEAAKWNPAIIKFFISPFPVSFLKKTKCKLSPQLIIKY